MSSLPVPTQWILQEANRGSTTQAYQNALYRRIFQLKAELRLLESCRNAIVPANRLPAEVLSMVFRNHAAMVVETFEPWDRRSFATIHVAHVCRFWRQVAHDCKELWTRPLFLGPGLTNYMLQVNAQSNNAPLTIKYRGERTPNYTDALAEALSRTDRIKCIEISEGEVGRGILSQASGYAPLLEKVSLDFYEDCEEWESIPEDFLKGGAPMLKILSVTGMLIPDWSVLPLGRSITHLKLTVPSGLEYDGRPSSKAFRNSLKEMPLLRSLSLSYFLPDDGAVTRSPSAFPLISFRALEDLVLEDRFDDINDFFQGYSIPTATHVTLQAGYLENNDELRGLLERLKVSWEKQMELSALTMTAGLDYDGAQQFIFNLNPLNYSPVSLSVAFLFNRPTCVDGAFSAFCEHLHIGSIASLTVWQEFSAEHWRTFGRLQDLMELTVHGPSISGFLAALEEAFGKDARTSNISNVFPALRTLEFKEVNFKDGTHGLRRSLACLPERHRYLSLRFVRCTNFGADDFMSLAETLPDMQVALATY
ncbi:hypothetical protein DFP72DRAFT_1163801 [Ephemerocybe angulata]|uniref:F-box domain-containing protein n=1 Tax=Ephemerocybe angulata TaxID=980116 RepID=A0A8H6MFW4_9AGAR|nr:hypothetical protein DFP72DRAFT_1163801 [Tulosesus angulatus]